ncbi:hypothetical protein JOQ06_006441, partial [Pogonophryne albipinna]
MRNQAKLRPHGTTSVWNQRRGLCHGFYWLLPGRVVLKIYTERGTVSLSGGSKGPVSPCEVYNVFYLGRWKKGAFVRCYGDVQRESVTLTFGRVQPPGAAAMFGVVVDEHVVGDGENVTVDVH